VGAERFGVEATRITDVRLEEEPQQVIDSIARHLARRHRDRSAYSGRSPGSPSG
jgi:hypothetical protein